MGSRSAPASTRLSVVGPRGRLDLAVPAWATVGAVAAAYADHTGLARPPVLATVSGEVTPPHGTVDELSLRSGSVLTVVGHDGAATRAERAERGGGERPASPPAGNQAAPVRMGLLLAAALAAALTAGVATLPSYPGPARWLCVGVLLICTVTTLRQVVTAPPVQAEAVAVVTPVFGAAAGWSAGYTPGPGGVHVGVLVAGLAAVVTATVARSALSPRADERLRVWLVCGAGAAAAGLLLLLTGVPVSALFALAYAAAVTAARLLPSAALDVPDDVLLDLDRLAVTAWSAREQPRGRRRTLVRPDEVAELARRGQRILVAGTLAAALTTVVSAAVVLGSTRHLGATSLGAQLMVAAGACALALTARSVRALLPRLALRTAAAWSFVLLAWQLVGDHAPGAAWPWFAGGAVLGAVAVLAAVLLGRGWRSVWWARAADVSETLSVVLVLATVPVATELFTLVRAWPG